jgi:hypothetical protein
MNIQNELTEHFNQFILSEHISEKRRKIVLQQNCVDNDLIKEHALEDYLEFGINQLDIQEHVARKIIQAYLDDYKRINICESSIVRFVFPRLSRLKKGDEYCC